MHTLARRGQRHGTCPPSAHLTWLRVCGRSAKAEQQQHTCVSGLGRLTPGARAPGPQSQHTDGQTKLAQLPTSSTCPLAAGQRGQIQPPGLMALTVSLPASIPRSNTYPLSPHTPSISHLQLPLVQHPHSVLRLGGRHLAAAPALLRPRLHSQLKLPGARGLPGAMRQPRALHASSSLPPFTHQQYCSPSSQPANPFPSYGAVLSLPEPHACASTPAATETHWILSLAHRNAFPPDPALATHPRACPAANSPPRLLLHPHPSVPIPHMPNVNPLRCPLASRSASANSCHHMGPSGLVPLPQNPEVPALCALWRTLPPPCALAIHPTLPAPPATRPQAITRSLAQTVASLGRSP